MRELLEHLYDLTGRRVDPIYSDWRPGDVWMSGANIKKARADLGYEPKVALDEGLAKMLDWFAKNEGV